MKPRAFIENLGIKSLVLCFSGGRDSLVSTHYTLREVEGLDIDAYVVWVDTTVALPGIREYVEETCREHGWPLKILRPEKDFEAHALHKGMPRISARWCCYHLKLKPIMDFTSKLRHPRCEVTGLRREESKRRKDLAEYFWFPKGRVWKYAPLITWTHRDVSNYIKRHGLKVNPIYQIIDSSGECICGVYTSKRQLKIIRALYPEFFKRFVDIEQKFRPRLGKPRSAFWKKGALYAKDLWAQKTLEDFM